MRKQYTMSPDEFIPLHPNQIDAFRLKLQECVYVLGFVTDALWLADKKKSPIEGSQGVLSLLHDRLSKLHEEIEPEALRVRHEKWQAEFGNIR